MDGAVKDEGIKEDGVNRGHSLECLEMSHPLTGGRRSILHPRVHKDIEHGHYIHTLAWSLLYISLLQSQINGRNTVIHGLQSDLIDFTGRE